MQGRRSGVRPWRTLTSKVALDEKWLRVRKDTVQSPSGKVQEDYFVWESPHLVVVVPVTPDGKLLLIRQYRHAVGIIMYTFPAGGVEEGERAEQAAVRELEEETGYICTGLIPLGTGAPYATKLTGPADIYLAKNARPGGIANRNEWEDAEIILMEPDELMNMLGGHEIQQMDLLAATLLALRYLEVIPSKIHLQGL